MFRKTMVFSLFASLALTVSFQGCGQVGFDSPADEKSRLQGGEGFDGKVYASYGLCGKQIELSDVIVVSHDRLKAGVLRENCQRQPTPRDLPLSELNFASTSDKVLEWQNKIFDEQVAGETQQLTQSFCRSIGGAPGVESLIWSHSSIPDSLLGSVTTTSGLSSGPLHVYAPSALEPLRYLTLPDQQSSFDLLEGISLDYSINSSPLVSVTSLNCVSQAAPVSLIQSQSQVASGGGVNYSFPINSTQSGNLLVLGLSIYNSTNACTAVVTDNAPGGGNTFVSANAYSRDSNAGSTEIWFAPNSRPGGTTVTVTLDASCAGIAPATYFAEFSGMALSDPLHGGAQVLNQQGENLLVSSPVISTSVERTMIFSVASVQYNIAGLEAGSAFQPLPMAHGDAAAFRIVTTPGNYQAIWNQDRSGTYSSSTVSFRAAW